ncbi:sigma 54-interacting transcriptional regulator [Candidatus Zixiibacteriota bacterium]
MALSRPHLLTLQASHAYDGQTVDTSDLESSVDSTQRIYELTTLYEVSRILLGSRTPGHLAFDALTAAMGLAGSEWGFLWATATPGSSLRLLSACGQAVQTAGPADLSEEWRSRLALQSQPVLWDDILSGTLSDGDPVSSPVPSWLESLQPAIIIPLSERGTLLGLIALGANPLNRPYEPFHLGLLGSVGYLIAVALGRYSGEMGSDLQPAPPSIQEFRKRYPMLSEIVGKSHAVLDLYERLTAVAQSSCTVLFEGETGSGKELAAKVLHRLSSRQDGPFIELDCGAVPENLIESELFGHAKGSFTGATQSRKGVFELATGGTLFLDEVANLPLQTQNRLLRVLQERRFRPIGGEQSTEVDVRVIAASNRDLREAVEDGSFREDLFYRLYVYPIRIAPLRERKEDIPLLAAHYLKFCATENGLPIPRMTDDFIQRLTQHDFPGNIREFRHLVEWALLRSTGKDEISIEAIDEALGQRSIDNGIEIEMTPPPETIPQESVEAVHSTPEEMLFPRKAGIERGIWVVDLLRHHRFNVKATAETLTSLSRTDPDNPPPLTDRSSLTYYFQVECFRLFLEHAGAIPEAAAAIVGDVTTFIPTVTRRMTGYLESAYIVLQDCTDQEIARETLREKFLKLPEDYLTILDRLADLLWEQRGLDQESPTRTTGRIR